jgi:hypothetical protein
MKGALSADGAVRLKSSRIWLSLMNRWVSRGSPHRATCISGAWPYREMVPHPFTWPVPISSVGTSRTIAATLRPANRFE